MTSADSAANTESKRISVLFQKAQASNSVREKNFFLNELKKMMKKHAADYSSAVSESERLDGAIAEVKANFNKVNEQYQDLKKSVAFLTELEFYQAAPDVASLKGMIESLERDISSIGPLPDRDGLVTIVQNSTSQEQMYLSLLDFRESRLRQLVEALKQRIRSAEQRLECASVVIDQFGSISNLLDKVRQLQDENDKLKVRQVRFSPESLLRPRRLTKCEPSTLRAFLVALQNELAVVRSSVSAAQMESERSISALPDESELLSRLLQNSNLKFSDPLPALTHSPIDVRSAASSASSSDSVEVQLIQLDNQYAALKEKTQRLRSELTLRKNAERLASESGRQRLEKLHALNERLLTEIQSLQEQSDSAEASKQILSEMLEQISSERDRMQSRSAQLSSDYERLYNDHMRMREEFKRTWRAGAGLFRLTELFGKAYLSQVLEPSDSASVAFTPKDASIHSVPDFTECLPPALQKFIEDIHADLLRRRAVELIDLGPGKHCKELEDSMKNLVSDESFSKVSEFVSKAPEEVLSQLSDKKKVGEIFEEMLSGIKKDTSEHIGDFSNYMDDSLKRVKMASDPILCKVKRAMSSQTFQARKNDVETQFNKADLPRGRKVK